MNNFTGCVNGLVAGRGFYQFQFVTEFDIANDIWYTQNAELELADYTTDHSASTTTNDAIGRYRTQETVDSFADKMNFSVIDDATHEFVKRFTEVHETSDSEYMKLVNGGLNVRYVQVLGNGIKVLEWFCTTITSPPKFGMQKGSGDAVQEMTVNFNKAPNKAQVGIEIELPCDLTEASGTVVATPSAGGLSVVISDIIDPDNLIVDGELVCTLIGKVEGCRKNAYYYTSTTQTVSDLATGATFTFAGLPAGEYAYSISHKLQENDYRMFTHGSGIGVVE